MGQYLDMKQFFTELEWEHRKLPQQSFLTLFFRAIYSTELTRFHQVNNVLEFWQLLYVERCCSMETT